MDVLNLALPIMFADIAKQL